ncbi:ATP-dependent helicase, partial [Streptomyces sp. NPDC014623]
REMTRLMADAGITPQVAQVRSGEAELNRITGARIPSGIPVVITAPVVERPRRGVSSRGRRRPVSATRRASVLQTVVDAAA